MTYKEAVRYIEDIPNFTKKTELANTRRLLKLLGAPQDQMRVVHVAGTNGKGSVCAFLTGICKEEGRRTGTFTSPHLVEIRERIQINGQMVSEEAFAASCCRLRWIAAQMEEEGYRHPAYFEFLFGMAMDIFAREGVDTAILETGLGGRLDATNAVEHPAVTVITSVSMDHMEYLGNTIEAIAGEKAGIIRQGIPVVYWAGNPAAAAVVEDKAKEKQAEAIPVSEENYEILKIGNKNIDFSLFCRYYENSLFSLPFTAPYQVGNAALALVTAACLRENCGQGQCFTEETVREGLLHAVWPGRMEEVCPGVFVDGAHNEDGVRAFIDAVRARQDTNEKYLLFSAVKEKDYEKMVRLLCEEIGWKGIILTEIEGGRRLACDIVKPLFLRYSEAEVEACPDSREAFAAAFRRKGRTGTLYCAGSLYLVGEIKKLLRDEQAQASAQKWGKI